MKNSLARQLFFFFILLLFTSPLFSQGKFEVSGGLAFPEYLNIKLRYGGRFQVGAGFGMYSNQDLNKKFYSVDCYYHFAKSKTSDLYSWYLNSGLTYEPTNYTFDSEEKSLFYFFRSGRSFNFSKHMGIKLDIGFTFGNEWSIVYGRGPAMYGRVLSDTKEFRFYPAGSFSYFFRF